MHRTTEKDKYRLRTRSSVYMFVMVIRKLEIIDLVEDVDLDELSTLANEYTEKVYRGMPDALGIP